MLLPKVKKEFQALLADLIPVEPVAEVAAPAEGEEKAKAPSGPVAETSHHQKGYHLDVTAPAERIVAAAEILDRNGFFIESITGVDWLKEGQFEVIYDFSHYTELCRVAVRLRIDRTNPEVPTISMVYPGADWHERETHDFFGIVFVGLADLGPFLLPEDADFHPLLKDYAP